MINKENLDQIGYLENWFAVENIDDKTYVISEYKHYEQPHCYLVIGSEKAALIDTGLGVANICEIIRKITDLHILVITTHVHWDHIGGHKYFEKFAVHKDDASWIKDKFRLPLETVKSELLKYECEFPDSFDIENYKVFSGTPEIIFTDGEKIDLGNRILKIIHTPGHSPGHICVFEEETGYLFSGDLIYKGKLDMFYESTNPIDFMNSIEKVSKLKINKLFPDHFNMDISPSIIFEILKTQKTLSTK